MTDTRAEQLNRLTVRILEERAEELSKEARDRMDLALASPEPTPSRSLAEIMALLSHWASLEHSRAKIELHSLD